VNRNDKTRFKLSKGAFPVTFRNIVATVETKIRAIMTLIEIAPIRN